MTQGAYTNVQSKVEIMVSYTNILVLYKWFVRGVHFFFLSGLSFAEVHESHDYKAYKNRIDKPRETAWSQFFIKILGMLTES